MTSVPGSEPHPDVAEISDLTAGMLAPEQAADVRLHLADCPHCADVLASLTEISELLGALPAPQRMPVDVADRIDAALAAAAEDVEDEVETETEPGGSSRAGIPQRDVPRGTSPSAPGTVPRETSPAPAGHPTTGTGPGRPGRSGARRRRVAVLTAGWVVGALALGGVVYGVASAGGSSAGSDSTASSAKRAVAGPLAGSVADQVHQLLAEPHSPVQPGGGATEAPQHGNNTPMLNGTGTGTAPVPSRSQGQGQEQGRGQGAVDAPSCVLKATHRSQAPLAIGKDRFQGTDAYLLVLPHPADSGLVDAFVVNASCSPTTPGTVLFQDTYPRR